MSTTGNYRLPTFIVPKDSTATRLRFTITENGLPLDLSSATGPLHFNAKEIDGTVIASEVVAAWVTDGSDGVIEVQLPSLVVGTVRDVVASWEVKGFNGGNLPTFPFTLRVVPTGKAS